MDAAVTAAQSVIGAALDEQELLLAAARVGPNAAVQEQLRRVDFDQLDWGLIWRLARRHGVAPLVFHTLTVSGARAPGDERLTLFRARFLANAANSLMLARELVDLLALCDDVGVAAMPYKGPALAAALYGNIALREFSDLDLLVAPRDVPAVRDALLRRGYEPAVLLTPAQEHALIQTRSGYFLRFDRPGQTGRIVLELHWRIPATFRFEPLEDRREMVTLMDRQVPHFCPEDLLLLLCGHGVKHAWNQLKWICDVAALIERRPVLDWDLALDRARRSGGLRVVLLGCAMAARTLSVELPARVALSIDRDPVVPALAGRLRRQLLDRPLLRFGVINNVQIRERLADKIQYGAGLLGHLVTPTVMERLSWPGWPGAHLVYSLWQPFRVAGRVARKYRRWNQGR